MNVGKVFLQSALLLAFVLTAIALMPHDANIMNVGKVLLQIALLLALVLTMIALMPRASSPNPRPSRGRGRCCS